MRFAGCVAAVGLVWLVAGVAPAAAQQNRWNLRLETGVLFNVAQPKTPSTDQQVGIVGGHLRVGADAEPNERISISLLYGIDLVSTQRGAVDAQQPEQPSAQGVGQGLEDLGVGDLGGAVGGRGGHGGDRRRAKRPLQAFLCQQNRVPGASSSPTVRGCRAPIVSVVCPRRG